jgi:hypothetical protein
MVISLFTEKQIESLWRLGIEKSQLNTLFFNKTVAYLLRDATPGTICIAELTSSKRFRTGIYTINNEDDGSIDFMILYARAKVAAIVLDASSLEILGIEMTNEKLEEKLVQLGFQPTSIAVPDSLGFGIFNAISEIVTLQ